LTRVAAIRYVLGTDPGSALPQLLDADTLPQVYGGALPFTFEDDPILDDPAREFLESYMIPREPISFVDGKVILSDGVTEPPHLLNGNVEASTLDRHRSTHKASSLLLV
jgi:hypothetical protein